MPANSVNRGEPLAALAALLEAAMVGVGLPVQSVVPYFLDWQADDPDASQQSPYVCLAPSGTISFDHGIGNYKWHNIFIFDCICFFRQPDNSGGWTEQLLEAQMNLVDKYIRDVIADNRRNANWDFIGFAPEGSRAGDSSEIFVDASRGCRIEARKIYARLTER